MPSKKKKYNARFPAGRIKKIMQTDEDVGKVAQAVPVIISRTLELFVESLLTKSTQITQSRNAKTLTPSHMKQCILSESRFDFLKDLVKNIPDASIQEDNENNAIFEANPEEPEPRSPPKAPSSPKPEIAANFYTEQSTSSRTPVIQYGPKVAKTETKSNFSVNSLLDKDESKLRATVDPAQVPVPARSKQTEGESHVARAQNICDNVPPLIPISQNFYTSNTEDDLCIDEDYDN